MESWRRVWREAVAPLLSAKALTGLRDALARNDARIVQGATTVPAPLQCLKDWRVDAACALGYCGIVEGYVTVGEVEEFFARMCYEIDQCVAEPGGCRFFLNWFDETPRHEVFRDLLPEVELALSGRGAA